MLLYHSISDRRRDPLCLATHPAHFEAQLRWLAKASTPLPLDDFVDQMRNGTLPTNATSVTFDDGYADNFLTAEPLLRRIGIPGTVFLATAGLNSKKEPWWEALDAILLESDVLPEQFRWRALTFSVEPLLDPARAQWTAREAPATQRESAFLQVSEFAKHLSSIDRTELLEALAAWAGFERGARADRRWATWNEIRDALRGGVLSLGGHTRSHSCLATRPADEQRQEISKGLDDIEQQTGTRPATFAYPFGTYHDFTSRSRAIVRRSGLRSAFANMTGAITARTDPRQVPRFLVGNWDAEELARRLGQ